MKRFIICMIALAFSTAPLAAQDIPLSKILVDKENWRQLAQDKEGITFLEARPSGDVLIYQPVAIGDISPKGEIGGFGATFFFEKNHSMAIRSSTIYFVGDNVRFAPEKMKTQRVKFAGVKSPTCLALWPDEGHLVIGESDGAYLWAVRIEKDGSLGPGDRYYSLRTKPNEKMQVTAMTMDAGYLLYACTPLGIQVFDPTGRLSGVIAAPSKDTMTAITIGGEKADTLFVASGDKIYARRIQGKAVYTLKK